VQKRKSDVCGLHNTSTVCLRMKLASTAQAFKSFGVCVCPHPLLCVGSLCVDHCYDFGVRKQGRKEGRRGHCPSEGLAFIRSVGGWHVQVLIWFVRGNYDDIYYHGSTSILCTWVSNPPSCPYYHQSDSSDSDSSSSSDASHVPELVPITSARGT